MNISKLEKEVKDSGKHRDFKWMLEQFEGGKLYINSRLVEKKKTFEQFRIAIRLVNEIYEGAWDLEFKLFEAINTKAEEVVGVNVESFIIHLPEITISNRNRKTHQIKDLFIKSILAINSDNLYIGGVMGGRTTWSYAEWTSDYSHSHLPGINASATSPHWMFFCTGSGHINDYIADLRAGEFSEQLFTRYLIQLMSLASYESIEGTPYKTMGNIYVRNRGATRYNPNAAVAKSLHEYVMSSHKLNRKKPDINVDMVGNRYIIKDDEKFDNFLTHYPFDERQKRTYLSFVSENGTAYQYGATPDHMSVAAPRAAFTFREKLITPQILMLPRRDENIVYKVHPVIKNLIKQELEYEINRKTIRKSTIDRYKDKVSDARESIQPDKVPVPANS